MLKKVASRPYIYYKVRQYGYFFLKSLVRNRITHDPYENTKIRIFKGSD